MTYVDVTRWIKIVKFLRYLYSYLKKKIIYTKLCF